MKKMRFKQRNIAIEEEEKDEKHIQNLVMKDAFNSRFKVI